MKTVGISKITVNNPVLASYVKTINLWNAGQNFDVENKNFYGVFLDDKFLAASLMQYDSDTSNVDILVLNGSNQNYDRIQEESTIGLTNIALEEYNAKTVSVSYVKRK